MDVYKLIKSVVAHETRKLRAENERLRAERDRLRAALEAVLASAHPHPREHLGMSKAWEIGRKALAQPDPTPEQPAGPSDAEMLDYLQENGSVELIGRIKGPPFTSYWEVYYSDEEYPVAGRGPKLRDAIKSAMRNRSGIQSGMEQPAAERSAE